MKILKQIVFAAVLMLVMTSCADLPEADFAVDNTDILVFDEVSFTNTTLNAVSYMWDFGDGTTSEEMSPSHVFTTVGTFTVSLTATNEDGDIVVSKDVVVGEFNSFYSIDATEYAIDSDMFWYQAPQGGDPYVRLLTDIAGQDNPDLLKLYPNKGLGELAGTYTWDQEKPIGTYDAGYTADYAGMAYAWTSIGKTGSGDMVITEVETGVYLIKAEFVLSVGDYNWTTFEFEETSTSNVVVNYLGGITALEATK